MEINQFLLNRLSGQNATPTRIRETNLAEEKEACIQIQMDNRWASMFTGNDLFFEQKVMEAQMRMTQTLYEMVAQAKAMLEDRPSILELMLEIQEEIDERKENAESREYKEGI